MTELEEFKKIIDKNRNNKRLSNVLSQPVIQELLKLYDAGTASLNQLAFLAGALDIRESN